jgi:hypothetical protein
MESESSGSLEQIAILVVGTDTLIEALPARPIQLANACGEFGFDLAIPLSWGDELVAEAALRSLQARENSPAMLCTCPLVRRRLLASGGDLAGSMVSLVSPPVALSRYLRATLGGRLTSMAFVGRCPGARTPDFDLTYDPQEFLGLLKARGVEIQKQPETFFDRLPADRRRHVSLPGGCPTPEALWQRCNGRTLIELESAEFSIDLAQHLISADNVLLDAAAAVGCSCAGWTPSTTGYSARFAVTSLEPPRSQTPIVSDAVVPELRLPVAVEPKSAEDRGFALSPTVPGRPPMAVTPPTALRVLR